MDLPRTERRAVGGLALDLASPEELARAFARADREAADAVARAHTQVAAAIALAGETLAAGGRLLFAGAGTSGRLAVMEAAECWPTFSSRAVVGFMAGGPDAFLEAQEGAEDDANAGHRAVRERGIGAADALCGVSASGRTPFVLGALSEARAAGARTLLLSCAPAPAGACADVRIELDPGPELLAGSTRLKAGTATKMVLNAITTGAMARCGKIYEDLMVDVVPSNAKLRARAVRIVAALAGVSPEEAQGLLEKAAGEVKTAVVMARAGLPAGPARVRLKAACGHLRHALEADR